MFGVGKKRVLKFCVSRGTARRETSGKRPEETERAMRGVGVFDGEEGRKKHADRTKGRTHAGPHTHRFGFVWGARENRLSLQEKKVVPLTSVPPCLFRQTDRQTYGRESVI